MRIAPQVAYVVWIAASTVGLLQALASYYGWMGLSFFRGYPRRGYLCAAVLVPSSYYWFFSLTDRNVPGLEGWQLFSRFAVGAVSGLVVVLVVSSLLNASMRPERPGRRRGAGRPGLDALHDDTYFHLLRAELGHSPPVRLLRAAQRRSLARVLSLLGHLSGGDQSPRSSLVVAKESPASRGDL